MPRQDVLDDLQGGLPDGAVLNDPDVTAGYRRDEAHLCPAGVPFAVVLPRETAHVQHVLRVAGRHGVHALQAEHDAAVDRIGPS